MSVFRITFDRNMIETCGFHRWKEGCQTRRILYCEFCLNVFFKVFNRHLYKPLYNVYLKRRIFDFQECVRTAKLRSTKLRKPQIFSFILSKVIGILLNAIFCFFDKIFKNIVFLLLFLIIDT